MNKKCMGCGAVFQTSFEDKPGYIDKNIINCATICQRCFRIKNYGEYLDFTSNKDEYEKIISKIKYKDNLILFLCDVLNLDETLSYLNKIKQSVVLVITKKDILPKSVKDTKIINYVKTNYKYNIKKIFFISSVKNYNIDNLYNYILKNNNNKYVYVLGNTNAGKSSFINSLIKSYSDNKSFVTTSVMPATTLNLINVKINDNLTLIDTPGIILPNSYLNKLNIKDLKHILPKKEIKPKTYQIKPNQSLLIGDYVRLDYVSLYENSITIYVSNKIMIKRINKNNNLALKNLHKKSIKINDHNDIVISTIGFLKFVKKCDVNLYIKDDVDFFIRKNLI